MKLSVNELKTLLANLPDAITHPIDEVHQDAMSFKDDGDRDLSKNIKLIFKKSNDGADWHLLFSEIPGTWKLVPETA